MFKDTLTLTKDLAAPFGPWSLLVVAALLVVLTAWTYLGVARANVRRVALILGLRLFALLLAVLMILRPSLAYRDSAFAPSILIFGLDNSESMTIRDEYDNQSRWEALQKLLHDPEVEKALKRLQEEQNVTVVSYQFADDARELDAQAKPDGKQTNFGQSLQTLFKIHGRDRNLRGLLWFSDGADHGGMRTPFQAEAARWRALSCPIDTFALGKKTTGERQRDIAFTSITPEPSPVPIKGKLIVRATLDAYGFENSPVNLQLFLDDKEVPARTMVDGKEVPLSKEVLRKSSGNEVVLVTDAPSEPREIKVTLKAEPLPNEVSIANNEISTFVTVTKEGIAVLLVDKVREEQTFIRHALMVDPRIRLYTSERFGDAPPKDQGDLFQFDRQHYDVIIIGNVTARNFSGGDPRVLAKISELVKDKGTGLLMMAGEDSFGEKDWRNTPIAPMLPVDLKETGMVKGEVAMEPTAKGWSHFVLRLADNEAINKDLWKKLPKLNEINRMGRERAGATVLAVQGGTEVPLLVYHTYGTGRVMAFAGDTTHLWRRFDQPKTTRGVEVHARFWRQMVLFLAKQDELDGNVWIKLDNRRIPAGSSKLGFSVGMVGKGGVDLKDAKFEVTVVGPQKTEFPVATSLDNGVEHGVFWKTDAPGEYRFVVSARGTDSDGKEISGKTSARFLAYQDDAEMKNRAANHAELAKLAQSGGGKFRHAGELLDVLKEMLVSPSPQNLPKTELWPDWRRSTLSAFHVGFFLLFVAVLCLEWGLRRAWGFV